MGERLGLTMKDIGQLSAEEFTTWIAYFKIQAEEEKKSADKARTKARIKPKSK